MPGGNSTSIASYNTQRQFEQYLVKSGRAEPQAPQDHELLFRRNLVFDRGTSLHFGARPWFWIGRQINRLRARSEVAKLIDAQFGLYNTIVTKRRFFANETLGDRVMKDCATEAGFSFNKIDDAALKKIAERIMAIRTALDTTPPAYDGSSPFKIAKFRNGKRTLRISRDDLKELYSKADAPGAPHSPEAGSVDHTATVSPEEQEPARSAAADPTQADVSKKPDLDEDYRRGLFYSDKDNAEYDPCRALFCFVRAHQQGSPTALWKIDEIVGRGWRRNYGLMFELYKIYRDGPDGVMPDPREAARCLKSSRHADANNELARLAREGDPGLQFSLYEYDRDGVMFRGWNSYVKGAQWLLRAARQGHEGALKELDDIKRHGDLGLRFTISELYGQGLDPVDIDVAEAGRWYRGPDRPELSGFLYDLGSAFHYGEAEGDRATAIDFFMRAAEQSDKRSPHNRPKGLWELESLARDGPAGLQCFIGRAYEDWREKDAGHMARAIRWYERAADDGHADAQYRLARIYQDGDGIEQDHQQAAQWLVRAAQRGNYDALMEVRGLAQPGSAAMQLALARTYNNQEDAAQLRRLLNGAKIEFKGVVPNMTEAAAWYARAAEQEDGDALKVLKDIERSGPMALQRALGEVYRDGSVGVPPNPDKARFWLALAGIETGANVKTPSPEVLGLDED